MALEYHEPPEELSSQTREVHRALASLIEELEAIDWYQHRIDVTTDREMAALLEHNRNEEMEHAAMMLELLRRRVPAFDERLRTYLFIEGSILAADESEEPEAMAEPVRAHRFGPLGIADSHRHGHCGLDQ